MTSGENQTFQQLLFALKARTKSTLVVISFDSYSKQKAIQKKLQHNLSEYKFKDLDLGSISVISLNRAIRDNLTPKILQSSPVEYIVNVFGLEHSLFHTAKGELTQSALIKEMNFERETLFRDFPFVIILWTDAYYTEQLKRKAVDLWDWITYSFKFYGGDVEEKDEFISTENKFLKPKGKDSERLKRISELEEKYELLQLDKDKQERVISEQITIQKLLSKEYFELHKFTKSLKSCKNVLSIVKQNQEKYGYFLAEIYFFLGRIYFEMRKFNEALNNYVLSIEEQKKLKQKHNFESTYYQIGMVYAKERNWNNALENYQKSIKWNRKNSNEYKLGATYHQIGILYSEQRKWDNALENYQKAFEWNKKTHNEYSLGKTYHQIGVLFHKQKRWTAAIENYNKALKWNKKTHNEHLIKMTYYQLGVFFEEQQNWANSLENYFIALLMSHKFSVQGAEKGIIAAIKKNAKEVSEEMLYEVFQRVFKDCSESDRDQLWKSIFSVE